LPERQTHDYKRYGTTTLFATFNILNGKLATACRAIAARSFSASSSNWKRKSLRIQKFTSFWTTTVPTRALRAWLKPKKRRRFHFTPTSSSWVNQVERWFGLITGRMIRRGTFRSVQELEAAIYQWLAQWNKKPQAFTWRATADVILDKVRRCKELAETPH
jgi:hypothetical protein